MATTVTVKKGLIGLEDINFESAGSAPTTFNRTKAGSGTQAITKLAPAHLKLQDANSRIDATDVEGALDEVAGDVGNLQKVFSDSKGADIASAATAVVPSRHLCFDVTGTTNISALTADSGAAAGRLVILQFDSALTVQDSSTLRLESDFKTQTGDHLVLLYDGTNWRELARTATHGVTLHSGPFDARNNAELGDVQITGPADEFYSLDFAHSGPSALNGFIDATTDDLDFY
tara:strand:- start:1233 stop:1928 length:696 start_codon:yes stop_codon:yes gene_type:complete